MRRIVSLCFCLLAFACSGSLDALSAQDINIRPAEIKALLVPPSSIPNDVIPAFKDENFPLEKAVNYKELAAGLTPEQKSFLLRHRFIVLEQKKTHASASFPMSGNWDEMLGDFRNLAGSYMIEERKPENAVFVTPDPFLHALHKYFSNHLKLVEKKILAPALQGYLAGLLDNIAALRKSADPQNAANWERLHAQMLVPLILLRNAAGRKVLEESRADYPDKAGKADTLPKALMLFKAYKEGFSPAMAKAIMDELTNIYGAETRAVSALFTLPYDDSPNPRATDYTRYGPRGHYEEDSSTRAYFRAMIALADFGWPLEKEAGVTDALNFCLAMSYEPAGGFSKPSGAVAGKIPQTSPAKSQSGKKAAPFMENPVELWLKIMRVSAVFAGYPDEPCYTDLAALLRKNSEGTAFNVNSAMDKKLLDGLRRDFKDFKPAKPFLASLEVPPPASVLRVLPPRFSASWLIADYLTYFKDDERGELPKTFSSLYVPAVFGDKYAAGLLEKQAALLLAEKPTATAEAGPSACRPSDFKPDPGRLEKAMKVLQKRLAALRECVKSEPETGWFSSLGSAWLYMLRTLTAEYGEGYPLYMRDSLFPAKQLQTYMGSFTELKHDLLLYEKPNYAEAGEGSEGEIPPVPKGFVEPNMAFWHEMIRLVEALKKSGIDGNDNDEEYAPLNRFAGQLRMCATLAEKELRGETITDEEYENLRVGMDLEYMAIPPDNSVYIDKDLVRSGIIVDVQTDLDNKLIVYEATARPYRILALVGNENSPRLVVGIAYNHYEFITPYGPRLTDKKWKKRVYTEKAPLPIKNFWYEGLKP